MREEEGGFMTRKRLSGNERRDQIADAVLTLAAEEGLDSLSVAHVAHRVGVAPSALYRHFPNKDAMIDATLERLFRRVAENVARAREESEDPLAALETLLMNHVDVVREHRGLPHLLFSGELARKPARRAGYLQMMEGFRKTARLLLERARRGGQVRKDLDLETGVIVFVGLFLPAAILWNMSRGRFNITAQVRRNWRLYLDAVQGPGSAPARARRRHTGKEVHP
jgi:TetR/AcrR family fatty acid metabolism transcriptional regulator